MHRPYIISKHAKIAEIRKLVNVTIYGLRSANYFGFHILSMFNNKNLEAANAVDYSNHSSLVKHKTNSHNMATKDYDQTMDYN